MTPEPVAQPRSDPIGLALGRLLGHLADDGCLSRWIGIEVDGAGVKSLHLYARQTAGKRRPSKRLGSEWEGYRVVVHEPGLD